MSDSEFTPGQLKVITYPHPGLRHIAKPIKRVDATLKQIAARMIELMYQHRGVGLAATQVNLPIRMFVWDPTGNPEKGQPAVYLNPTITRPRSNEEAEEGCLSIPGVNSNVVRAKTIHLHAFDIQGREIETDLSGYEARIMQHETDHLDGVLFIDRLSPAQIRDHDNDLAILETEFQSRQRMGELPSEDQIREELLAWERRYC